MNNYKTKQFNFNFSIQINPYFKLKLLNTPGGRQLWRTALHRATECNDVLGHLLICGDIRVSATRQLPLRRSVLSENLLVSWTRRESVEDRKHEQL